MAQNNGCSRRLCLALLTWHCGWLLGLLIIGRHLLSSSGLFQTIFHSSLPPVDCSALRFKTFRPYQCVTHDPNFTHLIHIDNWMETFGAHYEVQGLLYLTRHCSRWPTGDCHELLSLKDKFLQSSPLYSSLSEFSRQKFDFNQLTRLGIEESQQIGQKLETRFATFFQSLGPQNVQLGCTYLPRTCQTGHYILNSIFSSRTSQIRPEELQYLKIQKSQSIGVDLANKISRKKELLVEKFNDALQHHLKDKRSLSFKEIVYLNQILSLDSINFGYKLPNSIISPKLIIDLFEVKNLIKYAAKYVGPKNDGVITNLMSNLKATVEKIANPDTDKKFVLFATHEGTMSSILYSLGFLSENRVMEGKSQLNDDDIPMCANLTILVLKSKENGSQRIVTVLNGAVRSIFGKSLHTEDMTMDYQSFMTEFAQHIE
ncbi:MAG: hypothetical protein MHMPM18_001449 [Marteilia pararefringens]